METPIRRRWLRGAVAAGVALALAATPAVTPSAHAAPAAAASQLASFAVGRDGRLYAATPEGLTPYGSTVVGPPGAGISAVRQEDGNLAVFTVGTRGELLATVTNSAGSGVTVYSYGAGLAPPGARVSAVTDPVGSVHAFFVGSDGAIYGKSYTGAVLPGAGPQRISEPGLAPPGATVAAAWRSSLPGVVFVGVDGGLNSVWRTSAGTWTTVPASPAGLAPPGGGVAAVSTAGAQAYFAGLDGRLWQVGFAGGALPDPWTPVAISAVGVVPAGARLAAARPVGGPTSVFFAGADGAVRVVTNLTGSWVESATTPARIARPGGPLSVVALGDYLYTSWCGNGLWWWLFWWWRRPPPPPPPWYGETLSFRQIYPVDYGAEVAVTAYR
ncbi:hypothetical protein [Micromonospora okii]|uniref:hypothetical protein n=1 Tax=Micromonospora okii TaxID=1182970 RepID=UPI001E2F7D0E|nr:hypothetical protein [Micromonospora okii]